MIRTVRGDPHGAARAFPRGAAGAAGQAHCAAQAWQVGQIAPGITRATGSSRSMARDTLRRQQEGGPPGKALARKAIPADIRSLCRAYTEERNRLEHR